MNLTPAHNFSKLSLIRKLNAVLVFSILWFCFSLLARLFLENRLLSSWYPNAGLSLGFAVYFGPIAVLIESIVRVFLAVFYWDIKTDPLSLMAYTIAPAVLTLLLSYPIRRIIIWKGRVQSPEVASVFLICIIGVGFFKASLIMLVNSLTGMMLFSEFGSNLISWWSGDLIGMITVAPVFIVVIGPLLAGELKFSKNQAVYFKAFGFMLAVISVMVLLYQCTPKDHYTYWHLMIPIHVVAAAVMGFRWLCIQVFIVNISLTLFEHHYPSQVLPYEQQFFLTALSAGGLYLAVLFDEKKVHEENIKNQPRLMSQSDEAEALFVNILSHELRTPLSAVIGYAEIMMQENSTGTNDIGLQKIRVNTQKLVNIVDRLTSFVNPHLVLKTTKKETIDLQKLVQGVYAKHYREATEKKILLDYSAHQKIELYNSPDVLFGILDELISNSVKFTVDGNVTIKAELIRDEVRIIIEDSGIGMAQGFQPFATFEQESKGLTREFAGLGIGLSTCRMWAESIGGKLSLIYSEKGKGTRFLLVFKTLLR